MARREVPQVTGTVIRIAGASYSGSTALGYFLNTAPGFVFGSELYRLLPAFAQARPEGERSVCDCCGPDCEIWTPALRAALLDDPDAGLAQVYDLFFSGRPAGSVLVDGSKALAWYTGGPAPRQRMRYLVSVKHPLRMMASYLYNDRKLVPKKARSTLDSCRKWLCSHPDAVQSSIETTCMRLADQYRSIHTFTQTTPASWCRSDDPLDVAQTLAGIAAEFGVSIAPERMALVPCHSIGGNRSLVWQARAFAEPPGSPQQDSARWAYYEQKRGSGFVQDNKYEVLLVGAPADWVRSAARRHDLYRLLGYEETA